MRKRISGFLALGLTVVLGWSATLRAQSPQDYPAASGPPPDSGNFFSLALTNYPSLPYDPFPDLPYYALGDGIFIYDDRTVDYVQIRQEAQLQSSLLSAMQLDSDSPDGGLPAAYDYSADTIWLEITSVTNGTANFTIHTPDTNGIYGLFMTTNLSPNVAGLNLTNWMWVMTTQPGQINLALTNIPCCEAYFRLLPPDWDSDADGLPDWWEWMHFGNLNQTAGDVFVGVGLL